MTIAVYKSAKAAATPPISLTKSLDYTEIFGSKEGEQPMTCGHFTVRQGETTGYKYPGAEFSIVIDGEIQLEDAAKPGEAIIAQKGDVLRVEKGTSVKFSSPSSGTVFWVLQVHAGTDMSPLLF